MRPTAYPTLVVPVGSDNSISHAICLIDNLVFDSSQTVALSLSWETLNWIVGDGVTMVGVEYCFRFCQPYKTAPLKRKVEKINI